MPLNTDPKTQLRQLVADVRHRYDGDEVIHDVFAQLMGCITWGTSSVETLQNIVCAIWDNADEQTRELMTERVRVEHEGLCACCRARAEREDHIADWQKAQVM